VASGSSSLSFSHRRRLAGRGRRLTAVGAKSAVLDRRGQSREGPVDRLQSAFPRGDVPGVKIVRRDCCRPHLGNGCSGGGTLPAGTVVRIKWLPRRRPTLYSQNSKSRGDHDSERHWARTAQADVLLLLPQ